MNCLKLVLKYISYMLGGACALASAIVVLTFAAWQTTMLLGFEKNSPWFMLVFLIYLLVAFGTFIGIVECFTQRRG